MKLRFVFRAIAQQYAFYLDRREKMDSHEILVLLKRVKFTEYENDWRGENMAKTMREF